MNRRTRRLRTIQLVVAALVIVASALVADAADVLHRADLTTVNTRFDIRGYRPAPEAVIVRAGDRYLAKRKR